MEPTLAQTIAAALAELDDPHADDALELLERLLEETSGDR